MEESNRLTQSEMDVQNDGEKDAAMGNLINSLRVIKKFASQTRCLCNVVFNLQEDISSGSMIISNFYDDVTGVQLPYDGVMSARNEEIVEVKKHNVYTKVPIKQCWDRTGKKPIGVRWVDINKGDDKNPNYRSTIVAQDFNHKVKKKKSLRFSLPMQFSQF